MNIKRLWMATILMTMALSVFSYPFENPYKTGASFVFKVKKHSMYWSDRKYESNSEYYEFWTVTSYDASTQISHIEAYAKDSLSRAYAAYGKEKYETAFVIKPEGDGFMRRYEGGNWTYLYSAEKANRTGTSSVCGYTFNSEFFDVKIKESSSVSAGGTIIANPEQEDWKATWSILGLSYYYYHYYNVVGNNIDTQTNEINLIYAKTDSGMEFTQIKKPRVTNSYAMYDPKFVYNVSGTTRKVNGTFEIGFKTDPNTTHYEVWFYDVSHKNSGYLSSSFPQIDPETSYTNRYANVDLSYDLYNHGYQWGFWTKSANNFHLKDYAAGIWLFAVVPSNFMFRDAEVEQAILEFNIWASTVSVLDDGSGNYFQNQVIKKINDQGSEFPFLYVIVGDEFNYTEMTRSPRGESTDIELPESQLSTLYPNPASDFVTVTGIENDPVTIYDLSGRCVLETNANNDVVDVRPLPENIYVLNADGKSYRLIIRR